MWLCLPDAFLSIVAIPDHPDLLKVRARRPGDIERTFPDASVQRTPGRDYLYRAEIQRALVADVIAQSVLRITAPNFKNTAAAAVVVNGGADIDIIQGLKARAA